MPSAPLEAASETVEAASDSLKLREPQPATSMTTQPIVTQFFMGSTMAQGVNSCELPHPAPARRPRSWGRMPPWRGNRTYRGAVVL
jgi:hypothetical protein